MRPVNDTFDLIAGVGSLLHFPVGVCPRDDGRTPLTGLILESPSLQFVTDITRALPPDAFSWSEMKWTPRAERVDMSSSPHTVLSRLMGAVAAIDGVRGRELWMSYQRDSSATKNIASQMERARTLALEALDDSGLQPCRVLFSDGARWVWIHPDDVTFL